MKVKLITGAGGKLSEYNKPMQELDLYSKQQGFDFEYRKFKKNYKINKVKFIQESLYQDYDYIIWVDYDIRVLDNTINIMDYVYHDVNVASHLVQASNKWKNLSNIYMKKSVVNTGVMILKTSEYSKGLIGDIIYLIKNYYNNFHIVDNGAFLELTNNIDSLKFLYSDFKRKDNRIKYKYNIIPNNFNYVRGKNAHIENIPIVFEHFAGVKDREEYLR